MAMCGSPKSRSVTECDTPVRLGHRQTRKGRPDLPIRADRGVVSALASEALAQNRERGFVHPEDAGVVLGFP